MRLKLAYIGGGSKLWARTFMTDLALSKDLEGEIGLYDIDFESAIINQKIGNIINNHEKESFYIFPLFPPKENTSRRDIPCA